MNMEHIRIFILTPDMNWQKKVKFTQNDIRELQMAKAAIRAGVDILVKKAGIAFDEVDNCYLAGGFGTKIDIKKGGRDWPDPERTGDENDSGRKYSSCRDKRGFT